MNIMEYLKYLEKKENGEKNEIVNEKSLSIIDEEIKNNYLN